MAPYAQILPIFCLLITVIVISLFALSVELRGHHIDGHRDYTADMKNKHGVASIIGWGIVSPVFIVTLRYVKLFRSGDPHWLQVICECLAGSIGMFGWINGFLGFACIIGLKLSTKSTGIMYLYHCSIGIIVIVLATILQIFSWYRKPKTDLKHLIYWKIFHHICSYTVLILGVANVFIGFDMLRPEPKWKTAYIVLIAILGVIAIFLEVFAWMKPCDGSNDRRDYELVSTVQSSDCEKTCTICLKTPTIGDTIRHLPCFHKLHKECIDSWLWEKGNSCPVCQAFVN